METKFLYKIFRPLIQCFIKLFYKPTIIGRMNILNYEPIILAGNHTSNLDALLVASCTKRMIHFLAKEELFRGVGKFLFTKLGCIPVDRNKKNPITAIKSLEVLKNGVICIFPEGTINKTNNIILPFKYGAVSLSQKSNVKIVPFIITGKYKKFKKNVQIEFLKPYNLNSDNLVKENEILMNKIKNNITKNRRKNENI